MACGSSHNIRFNSDDGLVILQSSLWNNIRQPEDGMVVLQFSPNLVPQFGCSVAWIWMDRVPLFIDYI